MTAQKMAVLVLKDEKKKQKLDKERMSTTNKQRKNSIELTNKRKESGKAVDDENEDAIYQEAFSAFSKHKNAELEEKHPDWKYPRISLATCMAWYKAPERDRLKYLQRAEQKLKGRTHKGPQMGFLFADVQDISTRSKTSSSGVKKLGNTRKPSPSERSLSKGKIIHDSDPSESNHSTTSADMSSSNDMDFLEYSELQIKEMKTVPKSKRHLPSLPENPDSIQSGEEHMASLEQELRETTATEWDASELNQTSGQQFDAGILWCDASGPDPAWDPKYGPQLAPKPTKGELAWDQTLRPESAWCQTQGQQHAGDNPIQQPAWDQSQGPQPTWNETFQQPQLDQLNQSYHNNVQMLAVRRNNRSPRPQKNKGSKSMSNPGSTRPSPVAASKTLIRNSNSCGPSPSGQIRNNSVSGRIRSPPNSASLSSSPRRKQLPRNNVSGGIPPPPLSGARPSSRNSMPEGVGRQPTSGQTLKMPQVHNRSGFVTHPPSSRLTPSSRNSHPGDPLTTSAHGQRASRRRSSISGSTQQLDLLPTSQHRRQFQNGISSGRSNSCPQQQFDLLSTSQHRAQFQSRISSRRGSIAGPSQQTDFLSMSLHRTQFQNKVLNRAPMGSQPGGAQRNRCPASVCASLTGAPSSPHQQQTTPQYQRCGKCNSCLVQSNCGECLNCRMIPYYIGDPLYMPVCVKRICLNPVEIYKEDEAKQ